MVAMRGAFLSILDLNLVGIASAFSLIKDAVDKSHWEKIKHKWWMWGGEKKHLDSAVDKGKNKKHLFEELLEGKHKKENESSNAAGDTTTTATTGSSSNAGETVAKAAAGLGTISGVLLALPDPSATTKAVATYTATGAGAFGALSPILKSFSSQNGASASDLSSIPSAPTGQTNPDNVQIDTSTGQIAGIPKTYFYRGVIGLLGLGVIITTFIVIKNKGAKTVLKV